MDNDISVLLRQSGELMQKSQHAQQLASALGARLRILNLDCLIAVRHSKDTLIHTSKAIVADQLEDS